MADWKPGDSALCVNAKPFICASCGWRHLSNSKIAAGRVYQVQVVTTTEAAAPGWGCDRQALIFTDGTRGDARRFIKLPPYQFTEDDLEVIDLYKRVPERALNRRASPCPAENILSQHGSLPGGDAILKTQTKGADLP